MLLCETSPWPTIRHTHTESQDTQCYAEIASHTVQGGSVALYIREEIQFEVASFVEKYDSIIVLLCVVLQNGDAALACVYSSGHLALGKLFPSIFTLSVSVSIEFNIVICLGCINPLPKTSTKTKYYLLEQYKAVQIISGPTSVTKTMQIYQTM